MPRLVALVNNQFMGHITSSIFSVLMLAPLVGFGGTLAEVAKDHPSCTDEMVAQLVAASVATDLILDKINECDPHFSLDTAHLIALKQAGVPDDLVRAMAARQVGRVQPAARGSVAPSPPVLPVTLDEVGVYWMERGGELYRIEGIAISNLRTGSTLASRMTMGVKRARINAQIKGSHAQLRVRERQPQFYFYLPENASIGDYLLLRLAQRHDVRQIEVGERTMWKAQEGVDHAKEIDFTYRRIKTRLYLLTPSTELASGEYGFYVAAGVELTKASGRIYDFGID